MASFDSLRVCSAVASCLRQVGYCEKRFFTRAASFSFCRTQFNVNVFTSIHIAASPPSVSQDVDRQHRCQGDLGLAGKPHRGSGPSHRERWPLTSRREKWNDDNNQMCPDSERRSNQGYLEHLWSLITEASYRFNFNYGKTDHHSTGFLHLHKNVYNSSLIKDNESYYRKMEL